MSKDTTKTLAWQAETAAWSSHGIKAGRPDFLNATSGRLDFEIQPSYGLYGLYIAGLSSYGDDHPYSSSHEGLTLQAAKDLASEIAAALA